MVEWWTPHERLTDDARGRLSHRLRERFNDAQERDPSFRALYRQVSKAKRDVSQDRWSEDDDRPHADKIRALLKLEGAPKASGTSVAAWLSNRDNVNWPSYTDVCRWLGYAADERDLQGFDARLAVRRAWIEGAQSRIRQEHSRCYGREDLIEDLARAVQQPGARLCLTAEGGAGKTSVMVQVAELLEARTDLVTAAYFVGGGDSLSEDSDDLLRWLRRRIVPPDAHVNTVADRRTVWFFRNAVANLKRNQRAVVLIDGLDELPDADALLVPLRNLPANVTFLVSGQARSLPVWTSGFERIRLHPLDEPAVEAWITELLRERTTEFAPAIAKRVHEIADGYPLFTTYVLDAIVEELGDQTPSQMLVERITDGIPAPFKSFLESEYRKIERLPEARTLLPLIAIAQPGLTEPLLSELLPDLPDVLTLDPRVLRWLSVWPRGDTYRIDFTHTTLAEKLLQVRDFAAAARAQEATLLAWLRGHWASDAYARAALPRQLIRRITDPAVAAESDALRDELADLLANPDYVRVRADEPGGAAAYIRDAQAAREVLA